MANQEHDQNGAVSTPVAPADPSRQNGAPISDMTDEQVAALLSHPSAKKFISQTVETEFQSLKDRRLAKVDELEKVVDEIAAERKLSAEQKKSMLDNMVAAAKQPDDTPASVSPATSPLDVAGALQVTGFDLKGDADAIRFALDKQKEGVTQAELQNALLAFKTERPQTNRPASAASATMPAGSGPTPQPEGREDIQRQIDAIQSDRAKMLSADGRAELNILAQKLAALENA